MATSGQGVVYGHDKRFQAWKRGVEVREKLVASGKLLPSAVPRGMTARREQQQRQESTDTDRR